jgi:hypothetical protein
MKYLFTVLFIAFTSIAAQAQVYNAPESVEFDYSGNRWFIGNHTGHTILIKNCTTCALQPFATGLTTGPHGLEIVNDTLYTCDGASLRAYNILTGALIFNTNMGATFLNGITHDAAGNLYATDYSGNKIHRFNTSTRQHNIFVAAPGTNPNGIIYDQPNNRCVYVLWGGTFKSVSLTDSTTATVLASTLTSCDGIAKDGAGNYFVSAWGSNSVTRYTNTFTSPTTVVTGLTSPADIFYNVLTDTLAVPNSGSLNNVQFYYFGSTIGIDDTNSSNFNISINPNPVGENSDINYETKADGKVIIELMDVKGDLVKTITSDNQSAGKHAANFDASIISSGTYFIKISSQGNSETRKVVIKK